MILADKADSPVMIIIAGAPGSGKSSIFPVSSFGVDYFNADDHAAKLNGGSYQNISIHHRKTVNLRFERWIYEHIDARKSFALETTLRSDIALQQASDAATVGFDVHMIYVALESFEINLRRVQIRALAGGHSASPDTLAGIHTNSFQVLREAIAICGPVIKQLEIYDNSITGKVPRLVAEITTEKLFRRTRIYPPIAELLKPFLPEAESND